MTIKRFLRCFGKGAIYGGSIVLTYAAAAGLALGSAGIACRLVNIAGRPTNFTAGIVIASGMAGLAGGLAAGMKYMIIPAAAYLLEEF